MASSSHPTLDETMNTQPNVTCLPNEDANVNLFQRRKRTKTSIVWAEYKEVVLPNGEKKAECIHCKYKLRIHASGSTTHFGRHLQRSVKRAASRRQQHINFPLDDSSGGTSVLSALTGKFDMTVMRELIAQWVLMHEHPFTIVEEEGLNNMLKYGIPGWSRVSRNTCKNDCVKVYEIEKQKLNTLLKGVRRISLTTDLWNSNNQKLEYMVLTGHWIDDNWKLNKRVLNFVRLPTPKGGVQIADAIYKCLAEWEIEDKVQMISVDNASSNDVAIRVLKQNFTITRQLSCGGKMFHVRCCVHILNLMVQDGLSQIRRIINKIHESVVYINGSEGRMKVFAEIVQQLRLPCRKLILDCKKRWNSTYDMLEIAIKFKEVFPRYKERDEGYEHRPDKEDWVKVEKVCEILRVFSTMTNIISETNYPTSNVFLRQVCRIKILLDKKSESEDEFIRQMVRKMKEKCDKYWGQCNLLMAVAAILDPRYKIKVIEFSFPKMYSDIEAQANATTVRDTLYEVYGEYANDCQSSSVVRRGTIERVGLEVIPGGSMGGADDWEFDDFLNEVETIEPNKSQLDIYLSEPCYKCQGNSENFDALD
ncbi:zinc finger BED domain-containing protein RICESLEEPER 2-like [Pistacia vera]|uniref:zinc finger BED domain-containing protein RICESLEEPER 2-like n=1 Tax=Pistacia vera TaxID=55513 RepID=UPI001262FB09|nr:zinc finger BED domain-containing protein RICESLEEPER 2-like [Pistacia vera]